MPAIAVLALLVGACITCCLGGCSTEKPSPRGSIISADGVVLAETSNTSVGRSARSYPLGEVVAPLVGSTSTRGAAEGIEQAFEEELKAEKDVQLTVDSIIQKAAFDALGAHSGAAVVVDVATGEVLALASAPAYGPTAKEASETTGVNRATELYIPGSTFKTITLAAALEQGSVTLDTIFDAPAFLAFDGGSITNYSNMQYPAQTVRQAYAKSINTVFAQMALNVGESAIWQQAQAFGFGESPLSDFNVKAATIYGLGEMTGLMRAWTGVGQAIFQGDGALQGPVMTVLQGAQIAATVANGGVRVPMHVVATVDGEPLSANEQAKENVRRALSPETAALVSECMQLVVREGTGRSAAVRGVDVRGKTGTAETASGADNGWFTGFATADGHTYAVATLVEGAESAEASAVAAKIIAALFA